LIVSVPPVHASLDERDDGKPLLALYIQTRPCILLYKHQDFASTECAQNRVSWERGLACV